MYKGNPYSPSWMQQASKDSLRLRFSSGCTKGILTRPPGCSRRAGGKSNLRVFPPIGEELPQIGPSGESHVPKKGDARPADLNHGCWRRRTDESPPARLLHAAGQAGPELSRAPVFHPVMTRF